MAAAQPATQGHCVEIGVSCLITSARYTRCVMRGLNPRLHQKNPLFVRRWIARSSPAMTEVSGLRGLPLRLQGIFDRLEGSKRDRVELPIHLLDLAHVHVLHDLAGVGIDRDRPTRAFPLHAFHRIDQSVAFSLATGLL